mgnify:CR=1 FL=1
MHHEYSKVWQTNNEVGREEKTLLSLPLQTYLNSMREVLPFSNSARYLHPFLPIWFSSRLRKEGERHEYVQTSRNLKRNHACAEWQKRTILPKCHTRSSKCAVQPVIPCTPLSRLYLSLPLPLIIPCIPLSPLYLSLTLSSSTYPMHSPLSSVSLSFSLPPSSLSLSLCIYTYISRFLSCLPNLRDRTIFLQRLCEILAPLVAYTAPIEAVAKTKKRDRGSSYKDAAFRLGRIEMLTFSYKILVQDVFLFSASATYLMRSPPRPFCRRLEILNKRKRWIDSRLTWIGRCT